MTWLVLFIGLVVGVVYGVVAIGEGILIIPALVWLVGMDQYKAQGTSLGALVAPVGILAFSSITGEAMLICVSHCS